MAAARELLIMIRLREEKESEVFPACPVLRNPYM